MGKSYEKVFKETDITYSAGSKRRLNGSKTKVNAKQRKRQKEIKKFKSGDSTYKKKSMAPRHKASRMLDRQECKNYVGSRTVYVKKDTTTSDIENPQRKMAKRLAS